MNDAVCMMPWIHMHVWPDGRVFPCCVSDIKYPIGKWPDKSLEQIWNSEEMRSLRLRMLNGQKSPECQRCYILEQNSHKSFRQNINETFSHHKRVTNDDGSVDKVNLAYVDVRFSNICNLRCRTCGPELSSAWHDDAVALKPNHSLPRVVNINKTGKFWDELVQYLDKTEEVMFAGGESLITDEHYRILDYLIANDKTDVKLKYTTNFTNFYYKNRNLFDLWLKFDTVHVSASLDGSYKRGEYLRKGMVWEDVVSNRKRMILEVPFVQFDVSATVSLINILHLPDFNREWVNERLVNVNGFRLNLLTEPQYLSIRTLPYNLKARAIEKVLEHIDWLEDNGADSSVVNEWDGILQFMEKHDTSDLLSSFKTNTMSVDRIRSESFLDVFPELGELYDVGR